MKRETERVLRWLAASLSLFVSAGAASAKACHQSDPSGVAVVTGSGRAYFHDDADLCPGHHDYCLKRAYVIAKDRVLTAGSEDGYTCVFAPSSTATTIGWIETKRLQARVINSSPPLAAWQGAWKSEVVMSIRVLCGKFGLQASGIENWRSGDGTDADGRVSLPGREHHAEFSGRLRVSGNRARIEDADCSVDLTLLGGFLIVADNVSCGDPNTSFRGVYRRKP